MWVCSKTGVINFCFNYAEEISGSTSFLISWFQFLSKSAPSLKPFVDGHSWSLTCCSRCCWIVQGIREHGSVWHPLSAPDCSCWKRWRRLWPSHHWNIESTCVFHLSDRQRRTYFEHKFKHIIFSATLQARQWLQALWSSSIVILWSLASKSLSSIVVWESIQASWSPSSIMKSLQALWSLSSIASLSSMWFVSLFKYHVAPWSIINRLKHHNLWISFRYRVSSSSIVKPPQEHVKLP